VWTPCPRSNRVTPRDVALAWARVKLFQNSALLLKPLLGVHRIVRKNAKTFLIVSRRKLANFVNATHASKDALQNAANREKDQYSLSVDNGTNPFAGAAQSFFA